MGETRVNLKHLLEDIRDAYPFPVEEAILTELIANALDSGASEIHCDTRQQALTVRDNGHGMTPSQLDRYHDIAASTKERGKGIGFAGIGAKLALLIADRVITETRAGPSCKATCWHLEGNQRAPWQGIEPRNLIPGPQGTAVSLEWESPAAPSPLADSRYVESVVQTHFHPLLEERFAPVMEQIYAGGVRFWINGRPQKPPKVQGLRQPRLFVVQGNNGHKPMGIGFLGKSSRNLPEPMRGIGVSAYGKVIKRGWDWLGLLPQHPNRLTGIVEVPALAEILTTSKADFLRDAASLKKYYRHRKAIQETLEPILRQLGEAAPDCPRPDPQVRPVERDVEQVLSSLLDDYPEFTPLVGRRRTRSVGDSLALQPGAPLLATLTEALSERPRSGAPDAGQLLAQSAESVAAGRPILEPDENGTVNAALSPGKRVAPGLLLAFEDAAEREALGRLVGSTVWVNRAHPAYRKAAATGNESYHIVLSVVWVLLGHLDDRHSAQQFISQFLSGWGLRA